MCVHNHITCVCTARHAREKRGACVWLCVYVWMREKKVYVCVDLFEQKLIIRGGSCCSCYCFRLHFVSLSLSPTLILCLFVQRARRSLRVISQNVTTTQRRPTPSSCRQPESYPSTWHNCCCNWYFTKISAISKRLFFFCASAFLFFFLNFCYFFCTIISLWFCVATGIVVCTIFIEYIKKLSQMCAIKVSNSLTDP